REGRNEERGPQQRGEDATRRLEHLTRSDQRSEASTLLLSETRNSELFVVLPSRCMSSSIPSLGPTAESIRRIVQIMRRVFSSRSSSSRRVPDRSTSIAGKVLFSDSLRSRASSMLPVPLNSS